MCSYPTFATDFIQNHLIHLISFMGLPNWVRILYKASLLTEYLALQIHNPLSQSTAPLYSSFSTVPDEWRRADPELTYEYCVEVHTGYPQYFLTLWSRIWSENCWIQSCMKPVKVMHFCNYWSQFLNLPINRYGDRLLSLLMQVFRTRYRMIKSMDLLKYCFYLLLGSFLPEFDQHLDVYIFFAKSVSPPGKWKRVLTYTQCMHRLHFCCVCVWQLSERSRQIKGIARYCSLNNVHQLQANLIPPLMFFWPCIMNWLYINYQLFCTDYYLFIKY